jgi:hypothetical protein
VPIVGLTKKFAPAAVFEQAQGAARQNVSSSTSSQLFRRIHVSRFGSEFWRDSPALHTEPDLALAQTMRTIRAIRGGESPHASVQEEIRAALAHLCSAMNRLVEWMEQERRTDSEALQLMGSLREMGDGVVRCLSACPLDMIFSEE